MNKPSTLEREHLRGLVGVPCVLRGGGGLARFPGTSKGWGVFLLFGNSRNLEKKGMERGISLRRGSFTGDR